MLRNLPAVPADTEVDRARSSLSELFLAFAVQWCSSEPASAHANAMSELGMLKPARRLEKIRASIAWSEAYMDENQEYGAKARRRQRGSMKISKTLAAALAGVVIVVIAAVTYGLTSHPAASVLRPPVALRSPAASVLRVAGHSECGSGVGDGSGLRQGSGFVAGPGTVVTDAHVIYGDRDPMVQAGGRYYPATVVVFDPAADLAVLRTTAPLPPPLATTPAQIGTRGTLIGYPVRSPLFTGEAVITGTVVNTQTGTPRTLLVVHADGRQGDSGGPFITHGGRVAGVFELYQPGEWTGYFIPATAITRVLEQAPDRTAPVSISTCGPIGPPR